MRATVRSGGVVRACVDHTTQRIVSVCAAGGPVHVAPLKQKKKNPRKKNLHVLLPPTKCSSNTCLFAACHVHLLADI